MTNEHSPYALVVDDDAMILLAATDILEAAGFRCVEAYDYSEALHRLEAFEGEITLLFTDVELGAGENGFALARVAAERWPDISIMVASGQMKPADDDLPAGAIFVPKPFSADVVHRHLQTLLPEGQKPEPLKAKYRA